MRRRVSAVRSAATKLAQILGGLVIFYFLWTFGIPFLVLNLPNGLPAATYTTISCPVYQPPATPDPQWPTYCGGRRTVPGVVLPPGWSPR